MSDSGNNNAASVPEIRVDMRGPETFMKKESMKVFFKPVQENRFNPSEEQQDPVSIKSSGNFEVPLDTRSVHTGWYWAVFCVSLGHLDDIEDKLHRIIFDVTSKKKNTGVVYILDYTCKTIIEKDEIHCLPRTKSARLKLHRQIEVTADTDLSVSIKVQTVSGCEEDVSFDLNYFELACRHICSEDHVLWGEGKPDQFIRIGAEDAGCEKVPIAIEASDISVTGKLAVTVYFNPAIRTTQDTQFHARTPTLSSARSYTSDNIQILDQDHYLTPSSTSTLGAAHIDVWDLSAPSGQASSDNPQEITKPLVSWSFTVPLLKKPPGDSREKQSPDDSPQLPKPTINISSSGLHVVMAVGWATAAVHATPFLIFRQTIDDSGEWNQYVVYSYKEVPRICPNLQAFFGYGAFHNTDQDAPNCENERYFNFHGSTFDVYSTNGGWKQLYSLTFGITGVLSRHEDMFYLTQSLRGRYFAWTGDRGKVSIWDFDTGTFVNTVLIPNDTRGVCAALCEDGSMIAITVNGCIQLHDVVSGIKLGVHPTEWKADNGSEIIFRQDYFMALDAAKSTSGKKNIDARSIFRVRDMKVVKTHHVFWQYAAEYASTLNPIFLYRQGAILNIKRLGNILSPTEGDGCPQATNCELEDAKIDLRDNTWTDGNHPSAGITFVLRPAHSLSRILSIMRLDITNLYNNASLSLGPASVSKNCSGFYMASSSQLVLILNGFLQVWRLPTEADQQYELVRIEAFVGVSKAHANEICITKASSVRSCKHGRKFEINIDPILWVPDMRKQETEDDQETEAANDGPEKGGSNFDSDEEDYPDSNQPRTLTFPRAAGETLLKYRYEKGVASLLDTYADSDPAVKDAIIRFLVDRIRSSPKYSSSLVILCRSWKYDSRMIFEEVIANLLPEGDPITWIPDSNAKKTEDPLSILVETAKKIPAVLGACMTIMGYCVNHAIKSKNLVFLSPFLRNLKNIVVRFPNEAQVYLRRIAYIPVSDKWRDYVVENGIVSHPPWHNIQLWKTPSESNGRVIQLHVTTERQCIDVSWRDCVLERIVAFSLWQYNYFGKTILSSSKIKNLIMQLHLTTARPRTRTATFTRPIYVAAFDALWHYDDSIEYKESSGDAVIGRELTIMKGSTARHEDMMNKVLEMELVAKIKQGTMMKQGSTIRHATTTRQEGLINRGGTITEELTWWKTLYHIFRLKCHLSTHNYVTCHAFSLEFFDNPAIAALVEYKWNTIGYAYWAFRFSFQCVFYVLVFVAALLQVYYENVGRALLVGVFVAIIVVGTVYLWLELLQAIRNFARYSRSMYNILDIVAYTLPTAASINMLVAIENSNAVANTRILSYSVLAVFLHMLFELRVHKGVCKYVTFIQQSVIEIRVFFFIFAGGIVAFSISTLHLLRACSIPESCEDSMTKFPKNILGALSATYFFMSGRLDPVSEELGSDDWAFHLMMAIYFFFTVIVMLNVLIALVNVAFMKSDATWRLIESRLYYIELAENLSYHIPHFRQTHNWFPKEIYFYATAQEIEEYEEALRASEGEGKDLKAQLQHLESQVQQQFMELKELLRGRPESSRSETDSPQ